MISPLLASLCGGLFLAPLFDLPAWWPALPTFLVVVSLVARRQRLAPWLLCLALGTAAPLLYQHALNPPTESNDLRRLADGKPHILSARLLRSSRNSRGRWTFDLGQVVLHDQGNRSCRGHLRLYVDNLEQGPPPGSRVQFRSRLRRPRQFGMPGEFNYPRHLASQGIRVTGYLHDGTGLVRWADNGSRGWRQRLAGNRQAAADWLDQLLPATQAPLVKALLLGDRSDFSPQLRDRISRTGLAHLLAISGLHLGLLAWLLYQLGLFLYRRSTRLLLWQAPARVLPALLILPLALYTFYTGEALSTWRALLMFSLAALLLLRGERQRPLDLLQLVLLCLLLVQPLAFYEPGLQLSAAGVGGILLLVPRWKRFTARLPRPARKIIDVPLATLAATLTTAPLVGLHFHQFIPAGLVSNLFAIPLIGFVALPVGLAGLLGHLLQLPGSDQAAELSGRLLQTTLDMGEQVSRWPLLSPTPWFPDPWQLAAGLALILAIVFISHGRQRIGFSLLAGGLLLLNPALASPPGDLAVTAFAVGQGESLLLTRADGSRILIDGGGLRSRSFDVGERLLAPALGRLGIHRLDAVILTHPHPDHYRGLAAVLKKIPVRRFISALTSDRLPAEITAALQPSTEVVTLPPGWHQVTVPARQPLRIWVPRQDAKSTNDRSLVLCQEFGNDGVLFTGDLEAGGIHRLLETLPESRITLLKLPHHGSRHSAPNALLERINPQLALVSAGYHNSYKLPSTIVIDLYRKHGVPLLRTDLMHTVRCRSEGHGWKAQFWSRGRFSSHPPENSDRVAR
ncbi:DNA internalization-related competence protein ComEC/Rec2 [Geothermobacter hydrogeniphilus]|uniref:DNA internalization-related competence protein ComEC/Rec2 n=1 Tax=Geothermobacter hydrogeniphilus TaxID=1969733 RepID=A0A2K2H7S4_9BACT|nr:DNA internalization-related competence protein ComEC/Rec2 [Geothermobacter hydrogeniphilus]PNU19283.1 DNA internalization-related competence protein ComEC/Rec2 [Geothermobacter hydrogeniphilus]